MILLWVSLVLGAGWVQSYVIRPLEIIMLHHVTSLEFSINFFAPNSSMKARWFECCENFQFVFLHKFCTLVFLNFWVINILHMNMYICRITQSYAYCHLSLVSSAFSCYHGPFLGINFSNLESSLTSCIRPCLLATLMQGWTIYFMFHFCSISSYTFKKIQQFVIMCPVNLFLHPLFVFAS